MPEAEPLDLLVRALDQAHTLIVAIRPDQVDLPTPCRSWNISQLTNHVILDTTLFTEMARGGAYHAERRGSSPRGESRRRWTRPRPTASVIR
ncbi:MAG: hypothetical protein E6J45_02645 [Chloroflexi bacterium]|nr:MAG: hypothetical protein E6J45_02645 [Chloroflexota bacterium]